jgi:hypothetical protein
MFAMLLLPVSVEAQTRDRTYINTHVATQMVQDGKVDKDRLFIFYFSYLSNGYCDVQSITFNNLSCSGSSSSALPPSRGFWPKPEFCNREYCGDRFSCAIQRVGNDRIELTVKVPIDVNGELTHKLLVDSRRLVVDYAGSLSKYSDITRKIETANYVPFKSKSSYQFQDIDLGCAKMAIPAVTSK